MKTIMQKPEEANRLSIYIRRPILLALVDEVKKLLIAYNEPGHEVTENDREVAERFIRNAEESLSNVKDRFMLRAYEPEVPLIYDIAKNMSACGDYDNTLCDWYLHCDIDDLFGPTKDPYTLFRRDIGELHATYVKAHPGPRMCLFDDPVDECQIFTVREWNYYIAWLKMRAGQPDCPRTTEQMEHLIKIMTMLRSRRKKEEAEEGLDPTVVQPYPKFGETIDRIRKDYQKWLEQKNVK